VATLAARGGALASTTQRPGVRGRHGGRVRFNRTGSPFSTQDHRGRTPRSKSLNGRLRDECLNGNQFDSLLEATSAHRGLADRLPLQPSVQFPSVLVERDLTRFCESCIFTTDLSPIEFAEAWTT